MNEHLSKPIDLEQFHSILQNGVSKFNKIVDNSTAIRYNIIVALDLGNLNDSVAQLDRAFDYESRSRVRICRGHQKFKLTSCEVSFLFAYLFYEGRKRDRKAESTACP